MFINKLLVSWVRWFEMSLLDLLGLWRSRASVESTSQPTDATIEKLLEPLRASKYVGDITAGSRFLTDLTSALNAVRGNNFVVIPNTPTEGKYKGYLMSTKVSETNENYYDGRAFYNPDNGDVSFDLKFNRGAANEVRNSVGAAAYPLFGLTWTPSSQGSTGENPTN